MNQNQQNRKLKRFIFASDIHGDLSDPKAIQILYQFTKTFKPDYRILGGDLFDLAALRLKASKYEKGLSIVQDLEVGFDFLHTWKPTHFLLGNHDDRLWRVAQESTDNAVARHWSVDTIEKIESVCSKLDCQIYPYHKRDGVLRIGKLAFIHGFAHGQAALKHHCLAYDHVIFGHVHKSQSTTVPSLGMFKGSYSSGCLCNLDMNYNKTHLATLNQNHGFIFGFVSDSSYVVNHAIETDGRWLLPSRFEEHLV